MFLKNTTSPFFRKNERSGRQESWRSLKIVISSRDFRVRSLDTVPATGMRSEAFSNRHLQPKHSLFQSSRGIQQNGVVERSMLFAVEVQPIPVLYSNDLLYFTPRCAEPILLFVSLMSPAQNLPVLSSFFSWFDICIFCGWSEFSFSLSWPPS